MAYKSRLARHSSKESKKQAFIYLLLSVAFVAFMVRFGLPMIVQFLGNTKNGGSGNNSSLGLDAPLQAPMLDPIPDATFSAQIRVTGTDLSGLKVVLLVNGSENNTTQVSTDGTFSFDNVSLNDGDNTIGVKAVDGSGKESQVTESKVSLDQKAPSISIDSPSDGSSYFGSDQQVVTISGKVDDPEANLTINDNYVQVNNDGSFNYKMRLNSGENDLNIVAVDNAGNRGESSLKLNFSQ